jgi:hypothetical protein
MGRWQAAGLTEGQRSQRIIAIPPFVPSEGEPYAPHTARTRASPTPRSNSASAHTIASARSGERPGPA